MLHCHMATDAPLLSDVRPDVPRQVAMVSDTLRCTPVQAQPVAALLTEKTQGNPFFVAQFLRGRNGFIDKSIGDAVMALVPNEPGDAVAAAIDMHRAAASYNQERKQDGFPPIKIGVGLHCGTLMLGTIGELQRLDSTVIADAVNMAARLEGLTKTRDDILVSGSTLAQVRSRSTLRHRFLGEATLRGRASPIEVYEVDAHKPEPEAILLDQTRAQVEAAVRLQIAGDYAGAAAGYAAVLAVDPDDKAVRTFLTTLQDWPPTVGSVASSLPRNKLRPDAHQ